LGFPESLVALTNHKHVTSNWFKLDFVESANWTVLDHTAEVSLSTRVLFARVHAVVVLAGLVLGTVVIILTLSLRTSGSSVAAIGK